MAGTSPAMTENGMGSKTLPVCFSLAKRSNPGFSCRRPADLAAPRPLPQQFFGAVATLAVSGTRQRTISWRDGLLHCARNDEERLC